MGSDFKENQLSKIDRIKIFGNPVLPILKEKLSSLDLEIDDKNERIKTKELVLEKASTLSLAGIGGEGSDNDIPLLQLKDTEKWFGQEIINEFFKTEITDLGRERGKILSAIRIIKDKGVKVLKKFTNQDVENTRTFPLVDIAETYVENLRRSGAKTYSGHCPFHDDRTPSFVVYTDSNRYICFGCGIKGDVISFLMEIKSINFKTAVKALLALSGK